HGRHDGVERVAQAVDAAVPGMYNRNTSAMIAVPVPSTSMAGVIRLVPLDERGREIIDELEEETGEQPTEIQDDGGHLYHLHGEDAAGEAFDAMLSRIDSDWREHVARTSSILP
ncbi:MAG: hypothetical protein ACXWZW_11150, partial [Solirubrobacterales bacterium]